MGLQKGSAGICRGLFVFFGQRQKGGGAVKKGTTDPAPKEWLRPEEAADYLGIGRTKMFALIREEVPSVRLGRTRHVRRADLDAYMRRKFEDPT
jgi:excisionase family DNA binding protein